MPDVAAVLRQEIKRLARKEIRQYLDPITKTNAGLRRTVAALKREVADLHRTVRFLERRELRRREGEHAPAAGKAPRFSPGWVKAHRQRLGLSAEDYGRLIGVSSVTIYNWESGKSRPTADRLAAWAAVRGIGKREARRRLAALEEGNQASG